MQIIFGSIQSCLINASLCDNRWENLTVIVAGLILLSAGFTHSKSVNTHWVIDVVKALAGWEGVVGVNVFETANGQEHPDGRAKSKKCLRVESQLWVINGHLDGEKVARNKYGVKFVLKCLRLCSKTAELFRGLGKITLLCCTVVLGTIKLHFMTSIQHLGSMTASKEKTREHSCRTE